MRILQEESSQLCIRAFTQIVSAKSLVLVSKWHWYIYIYIYIYIYYFCNIALTTCCSVFWTLTWVFFNLTINRKQDSLVYCICTCASHFVFREHATIAFNLEHSFVGALWLRGGGGGGRRHSPYSDLGVVIGDLVFLRGTLFKRNLLKNKTGILLGYKNFQSSWPGTDLLNTFLFKINSVYWYFVGLIFGQGVCFRVLKFLWLSII